MRLNCDIVSLTGSLECVKYQCLWENICAIFWLYSTRIYDAMLFLTQESYTMRTRQNCRYFADSIFKCASISGFFCILIQVSLDVFPWCPINNKAALAQIMAWLRTGGNLLSESNMARSTETYMRHSASMSRLFRDLHIHSSLCHLSGTKPWSKTKSMCNI